VHTESGKSLCFQGLWSYLYSELGLTENPFVFVISPLISLIEAQVWELQDKQVYSGKDSRENIEMRRGKYSYVYSNPENLTSGPVFTNISWSLYLDQDQVFGSIFGSRSKLVFTKNNDQIWSENLDQIDQNFDPRI
jgi:superfamily II DNA helicase RecQ